MKDEMEELKANFLRAVQHHIKHCEGHDNECDVSLYLLWKVAQMAGLGLDFPDIIGEGRRSDG